MLKHRIIPVQLLLGDRLVKTVNFDTYRDVGDPVASSRVYNAQYADELVFLNIAREGRSVEPLLNLIERVSEVCFMPLAFGGGISTVRDAEKLIRQGADKVILNSACYSNQKLISEISAKFGAQAVVVAVDTKRSEKGIIELYSNCGRNFEDIGLEQHLQRCVDAGAGEFLINSIDRDGTMNGYDLATLKQAKAAVSVPVIGCGGAGSYEHLKNAFLETGITALACGSLFNFGDNNPIRAKAFLQNYGLSFKKI